MILSDEQRLLSFSFQNHVLQDSSLIRITVVWDVRKMSGVVLKIQVHLVQPVQKAKVLQLDREIKKMTALGVSSPLFFITTKVIARCSKISRFI